MDLLLDRLTRQAINYAINQGINVTAKYARQHTTRLLGNVEASADRDELQRLQEKLQTKIKIISPAIDMIDLITARGNTTLESAVELTTKLRQDIQDVAMRVEKAANEVSSATSGGIKHSADQMHANIKGIISDLKRLLVQIEDAVPLLNLAITASGTKISSSMPATISPSRLLQASTFMTAADSGYVVHPEATQVGPTFTLSMYMLFAGHVRPQLEEDMRTTTWKEVMHKAKLKLMRVPLDQLGSEQISNPSTSASNAMRAAKSKDEFAYQVLIIEDLDDDRVHTFEDTDAQPAPFNGVEKAGIREIVPVHELSKIFYADTGKILNIRGEDDIARPILLLKRDVNAIPPRRMTAVTPSIYETDLALAPATTNKIDRVQSALDAQLTVSTPEETSTDDDDNLDGGNEPWRIPVNLDPEWLAFEVYTEQSDVDSEADEEEVETRLNDESSPAQPPIDSDLSTQLFEVKLDSPHANSQTSASQNSSTTEPFPQIKTSLSLLEVLLRLASLQQFQQMSHLSIEDEYLNFFLSEAATTGAASGDEHERRRLRDDARRRVGFDPYDESPIKRRGEEYQYRGGTSQADWEEGYQTPDRHAWRSEGSVMPSVEGANVSAPSPRAGIITPGGYRSSSSELPPLGSSSRLTPERALPKASARYRNSLSPSLPKYLSLKPNIASPKSSPLTRTVEVGGSSDQEEAPGS